MDRNTVIVCTNHGMGSGPQELSLVLVSKFLNLLLESGRLPGAILFYTHGVKLATSDSPAIEQLKKLESAGVRLVLCKTCLDYFKLTDQVQVGIVGGMGDILEAMQTADKVISL